MTRQPTTTDLAYLRQRGAVDDAHARRTFDLIHQGTAVNMGPGVLDAAIEATADALAPQERPAAAREAEGTARRGYPLPPWSREGRPSLPTGAEVLDYLLDLVSTGTLGDRGAQAAAYLDDLLDRYSSAQLAASTCHVADHEGALEELRGALAGDAAVNNLAESLRNRPAIRVAVAADLEDELDVLRVVLAFERTTLLELDEDAAGRITEAAAVGAHQAYERERVAAAVVDYKASNRHPSATAATL